MPRTEDSTALQLRISLEGVEPAIWRRLIVPSRFTLAQLHEIFQIAMGWSDAHLHAFSIGAHQYGTPDDDSPDDELDEEEFTLRAAIGDEHRFGYEYDFGDGWQHQVVVEEEVITTPQELTSAVCLDGRRSCPPEDCGGAHRYVDLLQVISDPGHQEYDTTIEWVGNDFDPERFELAVTNIILQNRS